MFRGGGPVSSYGNGITAPLVPGYQMGGSIMDDRRGLVTLPGGYSGKDNKGNARRFDTSGIAGVDTTSGLELLHENEALNTVAPVPNYIPGVVEDEGELTKAEKLANIKAFEDKMSVNTWDEFIKEPKVGRYAKEGETRLVSNPNYKRPFKTKKHTSRLGEVSYSQEPLSAEELAAPTTGTTLPGEEYIEGDITKSELIPDLTQKKPVIEDPEPVEISAKDAIAENQELFKELLGSKKARGQDISDMLLRFSGSQGNTLGEKFQNYTRAESAAGPGRSEKINQTAAALAINDYVAGKRSKESLDTLLAKTDYDYKKKGELTDVQESDSLFDAKSKIARTYKEDMNSTPMIKYLINFKTKSDDIYSPPGIKEKDFTDKRLKKTLKKLKKGYNIYDEGGVKKIVLYDGSGNTNGLKFLTLSEIWET